MLEEEIDLRPYIGELIRFKYIILLSVIVTAVAAYFLTNLLPPIYRTSSIVAFIEIDDLFEFNETISSTAPRQPFTSIPELATSTDVLQLLIVELGWEETHSIGDIRENVSASLGADNTILKLEVSAESAHDATLIANSWAKVFVAWANDIFLGQGGDQVRFFEEQLENADVMLAEKTDEWVSFQELNQAAVISTTLSFAIDTRINHLDQIQQIDDLILNLNAYKETLNVLPSNEPVPYADQLTFFQLQTRAFQGVDQVPFVIQVNESTPFSDIAISEQMTRIDALSSALETQKIEIEAKLALLDPEILALQQENAILDSQSFELQNQVNIARQAITSLAFKVEEERLTAENFTRGFQFASQANTPTSPSGPNRQLIMVGAVIVVFLAEVALFIIRKWYLLNVNLFTFQNEPDNESSS